MSNSSDFELIHGQLHVTKDPSKPENLGRGLATIRGASYLQGPTVVGIDNAHKGITATLMVGPLKNSDSPPPFVFGSICGVPVSGPISGVAFTTISGIGSTDIMGQVYPDSLSIYCIGNSAVKGNFFVSSDVLVRRNITAQGDVKSQCGSHVLSKKKNFDIPHPTKEGWRLTHTCVEGPEASVYIRGRVKNKTEIHLPEYWKELVDIDTVTVNLTAIGAHQDVIIKRWDNQKVYLQSKGRMPIDCFYYIMAERKDTEKLIPEYPGSIEDYPGDNSQRSIAGYHYDTKGE